MGKWRLIGIDPAKAEDSISVVTEWLNGQLIKVTWLPPEFLKDCKEKPDFTFRPDTVSYDWKCCRCENINLATISSGYKTHCGNCGAYWLKVATNLRNDDDQEN